MWYQLTIEEIAERLKADLKKGLSPDEVKLRIEQEGLNELPRGKKITWWQFLFRQFKSPLVYILVIAAIITAFLHEWVDTIVVVMAVLLNVSVGFWQEFKSNNILEKLQKTVRVMAQVRRNGVIYEIDSSGLVPGDIIMLRAGSKAPADARIFEARELEVNEALLTGESSAVKKKLSIIIGETTIGDRSNMVHMGTIVEKGEGVAVVVETGEKTEIGKIALMTQKVESDETPLQKRIGKLGLILTLFVVVSTIIIVAVGIKESYDIKDIFITAIAVAVAAIPEGLPAGIAIILAISAQRILKEKGIIKRLVAAETLGSTSVICADKTGTMTEGKMKIEEIITEGAKKKAEMILGFANEAIIEEEKGEMVVKGESTDQAKMLAFLDGGNNMDEYLEKNPRVTLIPFDSDRLYIASIHTAKDDAGKYFIYVTGSPEVLTIASSQIQAKGGVVALDDKKRTELKGEYESYAKKGYRMIAMAQRVVSIESIKMDFNSEKDAESMIHDLCFMGFAAIRDPIREDVKGSINASREAGIKTVMLTGDHELTAISIGGEVGLSTKPSAVMSGSELDIITDDELNKRILDVEIFARVSPRHKMRIIQSWKHHNQVVTMTGDGVNDAPALKAADIGVALGSGTDVAKEASDLILLNNSFSTIVSAVRQGRIAFDNIRKVTVFLLASSFTELILIMSSLLFKTPLALLGRHMLFTNLIEDALPNVALAFEPGEDDVLKRKPISSNEPILDKESKVIIFFTSILSDLVLVGVFLWLFKYSNHHIDYIRSIIFLILGTDTLFYVFSIKSLRKPIWSYNLFNNKYLVWAVIIGFVAMFSAVYMPFLYRNLELAPISKEAVLFVFLMGLWEVFLVEIVKWWFFWRKGVAKID